MSRPGGRKANAMRAVKITPHYQRHPEGSALIEIGDTKVLCACSVAAGVPRWRRDSGMGWVTAEKLVYNERGELLSHSPTTYKIPAISDVPVDFRCKLFPNDDDLHNIRRSKAVGEPPLLLGVCVWAAVKNALSQLPGQIDPVLRLPATGEEILRCITAQRAAAPE